VVIQAISVKTLVAREGDLKWLRINFKDPNHT
jgi:hypothetical protein